MASKLQDNGDDHNRVINAFMNAAIAHPFGIPEYFVRLVQTADLPSAWKVELAGAWTGDPWRNAHLLTRWALSRGVNPSDPRFTTLGSFIRILLEGQGIDERYETAVLIVQYGLYRDADLVASVKRAYHYPERTAEGGAFDEAGPIEGPDIVLAPGVDDLELQSLLRDQPQFIDVGFLVDAMRCASSVCRIESTGGVELGSGFLVAPSRVLTNAHVVEAAQGSTIASRASHLIARFQCISEADGSTKPGLPFCVDDDAPLPFYSPVPELDMALLHLKGAPEEETGTNILSLLELGVPTKGSPLHILGHPSGMAMQLSMSTSGVSSINSASGRVQYVTRTERGSSGSPCFDDEWRPVAIHHAQRRRSFGAVREGILLESASSKLLSLLN